MFQVKIICIIYVETSAVLQLKWLFSHYLMQSQKFKCNLSLSLLSSALRKCRPENGRQFVRKK